MVFKTGLNLHETSRSLTEAVLLLYLLTGPMLYLSAGLASSSFLLARGCEKPASFFNIYLNPSPIA